MITEIIPNLFLGPCPLVYGLIDKLTNIDVVINVAAERINNKMYLSKRFEYFYFPMIEKESFELINMLDQISDLISINLSIGKKIYVHCHVGVSRSVSVVVYFLMKTRGITFQNAYKFVIEKYPYANIYHYYYNKLSQI